MDKTTKTTYKQTIDTAWTKVKAARKALKDAKAKRDAAWKAEAETFKKLKADTKAMVKRLFDEIDKARADRKAERNAKKVERAKLIEANKLAKAEKKAARAKAKAEAASKSKKTVRKHLTKAEADAGIARGEAAIAKAKANAK